MKLGVLESERLRLGNMVLYLHRLGGAIARRVARQLDS